MTDIKPIQTNYKGYLFRSRLEARWALFFDEMGIKYEYEPEGFVLGDSTCYLPDFYLPECKTYVEVKGSGAIDITIIDGRITFANGRESASKYAKFADAIDCNSNYMIVQGDPYDAFQLVDSDNRNANSSAVIFYVPNIAFNQTIFEQLGIRHRDLRTIVGKYVPYLVNKKPIIFTDMMDDLILANHGTITMAIDTGYGYYGVDCTIKDMLAGLDETKRCANLARKARFEHGEGGDHRG